MSEKRDFKKERRDHVFEKLRKDIEEKKQIEGILRGFVGICLFSCFGIIIGLGIWGFIRIILALT